MPEKIHPSLIDFKYETTNHKPLRLVYKQISLMTFDFVIGYEQQGKNKYEK